jgi:hypothetical protein
MRAQPRRGVMVCMAAIAVAILVAVPAAQSRDDRIAEATRASQAIFERWLGPAPSSTAQPVAISAWPPAPSTMDVEGQVAFELARRYWSAQPSPLMDGAARYLQSRVVARMFDRAFGRAGSGVEKVRLFGDAWTVSFAQVRFDGPAAGLGRDDLSRPRERAALAFASLERMVGEPRLIGALRAAIEARPATDADLVLALENALAQDLGWLLINALDPSKTMNYRIAAVAVEPCAPAPCHRVELQVRHDGPGVFSDLEVGVDFADGQSASARWDGRDPSRTFTFEAPAPPVRARIDPDFRNLLDDNLLDQSREIGARTNAPLMKWVARWAVWLQDAMLTYSALV